MVHKTRELRSTVNKDGVLTLSLAEIVLDDPASDEIIVRIEAAPINPSDLGLLLGPADATSVRKDASDDIPQLRLDIPPARTGGMAGRINQSLPVGNEGAGTVIAAGDQAKDWIGRRAALTVNPMTALGFVETARAEGHSAIVHTAAASSLGQMLQRICAQDGVQLVNIVRSDDQLRLLKDAGATHVLNSREDDFRTQLIDAVTKTGATIAFDAIGGGSLGGDIMRAMERGAVNRMTEYSRYGSSTFKQL